MLPVMVVSAEPFLAGLRFPEAPRWHDDQLWFSDMLDKRVCRARLDGQVDTVARLEDMPGGLGFLVDGTLLTAGMNSAQIFATKDGRTSTWQDLTAVATHLDDMVVNDQGDAYVGAIGPKPIAGQPASGQLLRVTAAGEVVVEVRNLAFPNGCAISNDRRRLLLNETMASRILVFDLAVDGSVTRRRSFADLPGLHPDGMALDAAGAVWVGCYSEHRYVRVEEGGRITDVIDADNRWATGVALGGPDGRTLFMTSSRTDIRGFFRGEGVGQVDVARVATPAP